MNTARIINVVDVTSRLFALDLDTCEIASVLDMREAEVVAWLDAGAQEEAQEAVQ